MPDHNDRFGDPSESVYEQRAAEKRWAKPQPLLCSSLRALNEAPHQQESRSPSINSRPKAEQPPWVWAGMGALVLLALFVIFVLPGIVRRL
jgi:hypothetical protein